MTSTILNIAAFSFSWWLWSRYRRRRLREQLTAAAIAGLLADHKDHSDECADGETCPQTVARLAVQVADEAIKRMEVVKS